LATGNTKHDSTQPRGSPGGINDHRQSTDPIINGFRHAISTCRGQAVTELEGQHVLVDPPRRYSRHSVSPLVWH
jgi:hypothetical protein